MPSYRPPSHKPYQPHRPNSTEVKGDVAEVRYPDPMAEPGMDDDTDTGTLVQRLRETQDRQREGRKYNALAEFFGTISGDDRVIEGALRNRQRHDQEVGELRSAIDQRRTAQALARQAQAERQMELADEQAKRDWQMTYGGAMQDRADERFVAGQEGSTERQATSLDAMSARTRENIQAQDARSAAGRDVTREQIAAANERSRLNREALTERQKNKPGASPVSRLMQDLARMGIAANNLPPGTVERILESYKAGQPDDAEVDPELAALLAGLSEE